MRPYLTPLSVSPLVLSLTALGAQMLDSLPT